MMALNREAGNSNCRREWEATITKAPAEASGNAEGRVAGREFSLSRAGSFNCR